MPEKHHFCLGIIEAGGDGCVVEIFFQQFGGRFVEELSAAFKDLSDLAIRSDGAYDSNGRQNFHLQFHAG